MRIHLGHYQRHVRVVAEARGVVDDHTTRGRGLGCIDLRHGSAGGEQADLCAAEIEVCELAHRELAAGELDTLSSRVLARQGVDLADRKLAFGENLEHGGTHGTGRANHSHIVRLQVNSGVETGKPAARILAQLNVWGWTGGRV